MTTDTPDAQSGHWFDPTESLFPIVDPLIQVTAGQVWRARWDNVVSLVFIDQAETTRTNFVRVAPVTIGADDADSTAIIIDADRARFATTVTIWPDLVRDVAEVVLERLLTSFEQQIATIAALEIAANHHDLAHGLPILNDRSPRIAAKRRLVAAMDVFASAVNLDGGDGSLEILLAGTATKEIARVLAGPTNDILKILRGERPISLEQAERLATLTGKPAAALMRANPRPPQLLIEALAPLRRGPQIRAIAEHSRRLESEVLLDVVQSAFALAARGEHGQPDWGGRIDNYLRSVQSAQ